ncbi:MAG: mechanosensitive ion channel family protein, partial [Hydrogenophaga sp.]
MTIESSLNFLTEQAPWVQALTGLTAMVLLAYAARLIVHIVLVRGVGRWSHPSQPRWTKALLSAPVLNRLEKIAPSLVIQLTVGAVPHLNATAQTVIRNVAVAVTILHIVRVLMALLDAFQEDHERTA